LMLIAWNAKLADSNVVTPVVSDNPGSGKDVGRLLFTEWSFPFEIASVIRFVGMVGAIVLAKRRRVQ